MNQISEGNERVDSYNKLHLSDQTGHEALRLSGSFNNKVMLIKE